MPHLLRVDHAIHQRVSAGKKFADIAVLDEQVFHARDLANVWGIGNQNTLHTTLSRYQSAGLIHRIRPGLYSLKKPEEIDPYLLGVKMLHGMAYISCESVLFDHGIINQVPQEITLVSSKSKRFQGVGHRFRSRQMHDTFLFNTVGIEIKNKVPIATLSRAIADMLYFYPQKFFDAASSSMIPWDAVRDIANQVGYEIILPKDYDDCFK